MSVKLTELSEPRLETRGNGCGGQGAAAAPEDMVRVLADRLKGRAAWSHGWSPEGHQGQPLRLQEQNPASCSSTSPASCLRHPLPTLEFMTISFVSVHVSREHRLTSRTLARVLSSSSHSN